MSSSDSNYTSIKRDHDLRIRLLREKQNEEQEKKLLELEKQTEALKKLREEQEAYKKKKLEEVKLKEQNRIAQVYERKRILMESEREKREAVLQKNKEREARLELKRKNERSSSVFAFGSCTPRILSTAPGTGVLSERIIPLEPMKSGCKGFESISEKRRATSAYGLDRKNAQDFLSTSICEVLQWSDEKFYPKPQGLRFSEQFENASAASQDCVLNSYLNSEKSVEINKCSKSSNRPYFLFPHTGYEERCFASSAISTPTDDIMTQSFTAGVPVGRGRRKTDLHPLTSSYADNYRSKGTMHTSASRNSICRATGVSQSSLTTVNYRQRLGKTRRPFSIAGPLSVPSYSFDHLGKTSVLSKKNINDKNIKIEETIKEECKKIPVRCLKENNELNKSSENESGIKKTLNFSEIIPSKEKLHIQNQINLKEVEVTFNLLDTNGIMSSNEIENELVIQTKNLILTNENLHNEFVADKKNANLTTEEDAEIKKKIITEAEAKAAIAEKRKLAREKVEKEAAERKRQEEEEQRKEEEERQIYEKQMEEQRRMEEERLQQAIEEAQHKEEQIRLQKEEEARLKAEKEEENRKTYEEAEKLRKEHEEKLRKEGEERIARKKRVEAIMSRTRTKAAPDTLLQIENTDQNSLEKLISPLDEILPSDISNIEKNNPVVINGEENGRIQTSLNAYSEHVSISSESSL